MTDIRLDYTRTELGVMPEDWAVSTVARVGKVKGGKRLPLGRSLTQSETSHPYIRVSDMRGGSVNQAALLYVPEDIFPLIKRYTISKNDIYISVAGSLGMVGRIPEALDGANLTENADKITEITCDRDYLYHYLQTRGIQSEIENKCTVGAQPKLAIQQIEAFQVALPSKREEQRKIGRAHNDADEMIAALEAVIAKKRDVKQGAMQELLTGQRRLPEYKEEWKMSKVVDLATVEVGFPFQSNHFTKEERGLRLIRNRDLKSDDDVIFYVGEYAPAYVVQRGDLLVSMDGEFTLGRWPGSTSVLNQRVARLRAKLAEVGFLAYALIEKLALIEAATGSTTVKHLSHKDIRSIDILMPPPDEQRAIATVLSDMDAEITALEAKLAKARDVKQGMMQTLLTGEIRLI